MLTTNNREYLDRVIAFARAKGLLEKLLDQLWILHTYAARDEHTPHKPPSYVVKAEWPPAPWQPYGIGTECALFSDFAPASFEFMITKGGKRWFNGGLIYHGDQSGWAMSDGRVIPAGFGVNTLSVAFGVDTNETPWSIHT